jgi:hypothetical protein
MADTDTLRPYRTLPYPKLPGSEPRYFTGEFRRIEETFRAHMEALKALEARIADLEASLGDE